MIVDHLLEKGLPQSSIKEIPIRFSRWNGISEKYEPRGKYSLSRSRLLYDNKQCCLGIVASAFCIKDEDIENRSFPEDIYFLGYDEEMQKIQKEYGDGEETQKEYMELFTHRNGNGPSLDRDITRTIATINDILTGDATESSVNLPNTQIMISFGRLNQDLDPDRDFTLELKLQILSALFDKFGIKIIWINDIGPEYSIPNITVDSFLKEKQKNQ